MPFHLEWENIGREAGLLVYMVSSISLRVAYSYVISKETYSVGSWRYDYMAGVVEKNLDRIGNYDLVIMILEINLNVEEEELGGLGHILEIIKALCTKEERENNKEGREKVEENVKCFKYFIHIMWESFLIYESHNPCSFAVSKHVALVRSLNILESRFSYYAR